MVTCACCKTTQPFVSNCKSCGGPLPKPAPRVITRRYDVSRSLIDVTTFQDTSRQFVLGMPHAVLTEVTEE